KTVGSQVSVKLSWMATGSAAGPKHARATGATIAPAGGLVSWTVISASSVPVAPALSVTVSVTSCGPRWSSTDAVSPTANGVAPSDHAKLAMSSFVPGVESGSVLAEPSRVAFVLRLPWHSRIWSGPATAAGAWFEAQYRPPDFKGAPDPPQMIISLPV